MSKYKNDILIFFGFILLSMLLSFCYLRSPHWDWWSYHYLNGWSFINHRFDIDLMPAFHRSYFNPILDGITYWMIEKLNNHPFIFVTLSSLKLGFFLYFAYKIVDFIFKNNNQNKLLAIIFCTLMTIFSSIIIFEANFDLTDIQIGFLVLLSFYIFIKNIFKEECVKKYLILFSSAVIMGGAIGLKYTSACFGVALAGVVLCNYKNISKPIKTLFILCTGMFTGLMITDGWWMYMLWQKFHNPLFPYFNNIFKSEFANTTPILNKDFILRPKNFYELIFYPFKCTYYGLAGLEWGWFDLKVSLTGLAAIILLILLKTKNIKNEIEKVIDINTFYLILYFIIISYYTNTFLFGNVRYIPVLFALSSIVIYIAAYAISNKQAFKYFLLCILIANIFTIKINSDGIYNKSYFYFKNIITTIDLNLKDGATILCGNIGACTIAPNQNPNVKYVNFVMPEKIINKNKLDHYMGANNRYFPNDNMEHYMKDIFKQEKDIYIAFWIVDNSDKKLVSQIYPKAIKYYSNNKIKKLNNCTNHKIYVLDFITKYNNFYICKIK